jgi:hypothetical protein
VLGFFRVEPDELIANALELPAPVSLYGRQAVLCDPENRPLSQVVEILPLIPLPRATLKIIVD